MIPFINLAICPTPINCETMGRFLMLWPDITRFGRITSDVITVMSVTDFTTVGHIPIINHLNHLKSTLSDAEEVGFCALPSSQNVLLHPLYKVLFWK